jgi:DHA1 family bicyclomycin/chloramphenicol resistance-like MFS transporter
MLAVMMLLPESGKADPTHSLKISNIFSQFASVLRVPQFITYSVGVGTALSGMLAFNSFLYFARVFKNVIYS